MPTIRQIHIKNFRGIKELKWHPNPGLNCIIGPGDSGKSTVLDAIDLVLTARRSYSFSDTDFYQLNIDEPIEITATLGELDDKLLNLESYGTFLRGFNLTTKTINDEPQTGDEIVISIKLTIRDDLEPYWQLFSERAMDASFEKRLQWKHRELISPSRLGVAPNFNLAWGSKSILNKLSDENINVSASLLQLVRDARKNFAEQEVVGVEKVLLEVKKIANELGVSTGEINAQLDINSFSLSNGAISLHNDDNTPLSQLGTGSIRLLISGLQKTVAVSNIFLVDEVEYGLEPFRITRLLHELGAKTDSSKLQVFLTTHSPYVLRELKASQLHVIRKPSNLSTYHEVLSLNDTDEEQSTLRVCAEAFFNKSVIICEGKTEIGLTRGIDLYHQEKGEKSIQSYGVYWADGGGSTLFVRAEIFRKLGYRTAIFKDSDLPEQQSEFTKSAIKNGIEIFEWGNSLSFEDALFKYSPATSISPLLTLAIERKGEQSISSAILNHSDGTYDLSKCQNEFCDEMREPLAKAAKAKSGSWFKDIEPAELLAKNIICANYDDFNQEFRQVINNLFEWAKS